MNAAVIGLKQCPECGSERLTPLDGGKGLKFPMPRLRLPLESEKGPVRDG